MGMMKENDLLKQINLEELLFVDGGKSLICEDLTFVCFSIMASSMAGMTKGMDMIVH